MATGIKIKNSFGTVLIDNLYPNLHVRTSGVSTLDSSGSAYIGNYQVGKVAVRSTSVVSAMYFNQLDPYQAGVYLFGPPGASVQWWVYDEPQEPGSNVGLKIRRPSDNKLMFDALKKPARVGAFRIGGSDPAWQGPGSLDGSRAWALLALNPAFSSVITFTRVGAGGPDQFFQREDLILAGMSVSAGSVNFAYTPSVRRQYGPYTGAVLPTGYTVQSQSSVLAILDVTNY